jgi:hypothetical protein
MNQVNPADLAKVLPIPATNIAFQYEITLDGSFEGENFQNPQPVTGVALVDLTQLPQQAYKVATQTPGGQRYYCGVNVFKDGVDVKYQAFFWYGGKFSSSTAPPTGLLTSGSISQQAGPPCILQQSNPQETSVNLASANYKWLQITLQPLYCTFSPTILGALPANNQASPQPKLAVTTEPSNPSAEDGQTITTHVEYDEEQTITTSVTNTLGFELGIQAAYQCDVSWFGLVGGKFTLTASLKVNYTWSKTSTTSKGNKCSISEDVPVVLDAHQTKYVSVIIFADDNATGTLTLNKQVTGSINGQAMTGLFLQQLVQALDAAATPPQTTTINSVGPTSLAYTTVGQMTANVDFNAYIGVFDSYPTQDQAADFAQQQVESGSAQNAAQASSA